ncbi:MAG: carbohydrate kinase [Clostridia bacterium]|jgi:L-xylulokinase|nr:carbohydrate kinase [Clostridia bacterium]
MKKYLMGIDNGSTMTKAGIYDFEGNEIAVYGSKCDVIMPQAGYYERDMNGIWSSNIEAISKAIQKSGINSSEIAALAITGHGATMHLVGQDGQPVYNAIEGTDSRAAKYAEKWVKDGTVDKVHPKIMQTMFPASSSCLFAWLKDNEPEVLRKAKWFFSITDFIRYKLTGEAFSEITSLSSTSIINTREQKTDKKMLGDMGIGEVIDLIAPIVQSTDICGNISEEAAELTGLTEGTPVAAGLFDICSAGIATGMVDETKINVIVGTWCNNQYISNTPVIDKDFFATYVHAIPGHWIMLEGSPTSASNLEWFVSEFLGEEKKAAKQNNTSVYDICNRAVSDTKPEDSDIVFVPFLYGSNANPKAKATFIGLEGWHKRNHVIRAIYEGICFSHKWHIEKILKFRDKPDAVRMAGGAVRSAVWVQMFADILQMPMEITGAVELGTLGAAITAGVGAGVFDSFDTAVRNIVKVANRIEPKRENLRVYEEKYERYKRAISSLDGYWM